jgi:hypothetical protein
MQNKQVRVIQPKPVFDLSGTIPKNLKKRVCAYVRVSTDNERVTLLKRTNTPKEFKITPSGHSVVSMQTKVSAVLPLSTGNCSII